MQNDDEDLNDPNHIPAYSKITVIDLTKHQATPAAESVEPRAIARLDVEFDILPRGRICCERTSSGGRVGSWCKQPLGHAGAHDAPDPIPEGPVHSPSSSQTRIVRSDLFFAHLRVERREE